MHLKTKKLIAGIMSLAMVSASSVSFIAPMQASAVQVLGESTFEKKALPWYITSTSPAKQDFDLEDGTFHVRVIVAEGAGKERWDLQFKYRNLNFKKGHEYKVSFKAKSSRVGMQLGSFIGTVDGNKEYFELDGRGNEMHMGPDMDGQWPLEPVELTTEWQTFEGIFKPTQDLECCQWTFMYARGSNFFGNAEAGDEIWFDDMSIDCLTCEEEKNYFGCGYPGTPEIGISPRNNVRINQMGYFTNADKKATYATAEEKAAADFKIVDEKGKTVFTGKTVPAGFDEMAGEYCQIIDFSKFKTPGVYTIVVGNDDKDKNNISHEFRIGDDIYDGVLRNALNYYYLYRSGADTEEKYITSGDKKKLAHKDINQKDLAYVQSAWLSRFYPYGSIGPIKKDTLLDVSGGWYETNDYAKSVVNGGTALWLLQNMYERSKKNGTDSKWADGKTMTVPEKYKLSNGESVNCTETPDILDEARYELEFMFRMIVDPEKDKVWGENYSDFVYDQVQEMNSLPVPYTPLDYIGYERDPRIISPPSYGATLNMIACAAQAARLWKGIDDDFAKECLDHAQKSWEAVMKRQTELKNKKADDDGTEYTYKTWADLGHVNNDADDEAYWAACELFATTGDKTYYEYLKDYNGAVEPNGLQAFGVPNVFATANTIEKFASFDNENKSAFGTLSLYLSDKTSEADKSKIKSSLKSAADAFMNYENDVKNGAMGVPYKEIKIYDTFEYPYTSGYEYGSNGNITDNAMIMAYAYDATGDSKYLNGALQAVDYIFGRNGLGFSYVTGCGSYHAQYPESEYWIYEIDKEYPKAPDGIMVGGPCSALYDTYVRLLGLKNGETPNQKCYTDSIEAWSVNSTALEWQAGFAWNIDFFEDAVKKASEITTTTTASTTNTTTTTTVTTSTVTSNTTAPELKVTKAGDVNCDGDVDMSDAVLIMQALANPNKYGENGTADTHLTAQGKVNGDINGDGLTVGDAQTIQKMLLGLAIK